MTRKKVLMAVMITLMLCTLGYFIYTSIPLLVNPILKILSMVALFSMIIFFSGCYVISMIMMGDNV